MGHSLACITGLLWDIWLWAQLNQGWAACSPQAPAKAWTPPQLVHRTQTSDWLDVGHRVGSAAPPWVHSISEEDHAAPARGHPSPHTS